MNLYHLQPVMSEFQLAYEAIAATWLERDEVVDFLERYGMSREEFAKEPVHPLIRDLILMVSKKFECREWPAFGAFLEAMHARGVKHHDLHRIFSALKGIYIEMIGGESVHLIIHPIFNHDKIIIDLHRVFDYFLHKVLKFYTEKAHMGSVRSSG